MSLLQLPPETLAQIFDYIGPSFFREDLGRLTVCKQWLNFALPACFKCVTLSRKTLRGLIISGATERPSPLKHSLEKLDIELGGHHHSRNYTLNLEQDAQESNASKAAALNEAFDSIPASARIEVLNDDLAQLAVIAKQSRRLRTLHIRGWSLLLSPDDLDGPMDYLFPSTIQSFLSIENLSVLMLDLTVGFLNSSGGQDKGLHICPAIGTLLGTLRTLHLRMRNICPEVLKPADANDSLRLNVVVVNLSLITNQPGTTSAAHSKRCGIPAGGLLQLKADMLEQARALAARMASPNVVRVLSHSLPQFDIQSLDVLTGKTMVLDDDMAWDDDGKTITEDSEPESDFLDDGLSNFSDE